MTAYGFLVSLIVSSRTHCCCCLQFPYALPAHILLTAKATHMVKDIIDGITIEKFREHNSGGSDIETGDKSASR